MKLWQLALKMLWRDGRSGELSLLAIALLIAVSSSTTISLFADRLQNTMINQAAEFIAADLAIGSSSILSSDWITKADELGLQQAQTCEFPSMLLENNEILLTSVKAVSAYYPLRGYLKIHENDVLLEKQVHQGPETGNAWVDARILSALHLKLGDSITVGEKALIINQVLSYEPDKSSNIYSFSPRVMINQVDLEATKVIQPGSRVHYVFQFSGDPTQLNSFKAWLKPQLNATQRLMDIHEDRPELSSALYRAQQYLGLSSIVVVLIAGVAIAMTAKRYSERHFNTTALLRCLGCKQREIISLFCLQFLILGVFTSISGCLLGWLVQQGLFQIFRPMLPEQLAEPSLLAYFFGLITGMAVLLGFALPPLLRLQKVSPLRVLRRDLEPLPSSGWLIYGLAISVIGILIWRYSQDVKMTLTILIVGFLALSALSLLVLGLLNLLRRRLLNMSLPWRFGLQGILSNSHASISQIIAFTITLSAMALSFSLRTDLIANWQKQLPEQAPNHFALNIIPDQLQAFQADLQQAQIPSSQYYPVVRGRLASINTIPAQNLASKNSQAEAFVQHEISLTTATNLPEDNSIISGETWRPEQPGLVSVEQKYADTLNIQLGDQLSFSTGSETFTAKVTNIRKVQWDTMHPNFYMIFSKGVLDAFPSTYLTSFYLPKDQKQQLNYLLKKYPATTIFAVEHMLEQFKIILTQLTQAINLMLYFALLAGFSVLFAAVNSTLDERIYAGALLRAFGASTSLLRSSQAIEFTMLGGIAGILAAILAEGLLFCLYKLVIHIDYQPSHYLWAVLPASGAAIVCLAGYLGVRDVIKQPPILVLIR